MEKPVWILRPRSSLAEEMSLELGLPVEISQIMINRGVNDPARAHQFLYGKLADTPDPWLMKDMDKAVARINKALAEGENIVLFGDYDVDGILSVVMLYRFLETRGGKVSYYIPHRLEEGYGLKEKYLDVVLKRGASLVISADCGVKATGFVRRAKENGVETIITDHHLPGEEIPEALAILNPVLTDSGYPDRRLAGVGVVFKLIQALLSEKEGQESLRHYLKLVSIGTVADVAELRGENRILVKYGLEALEDVSNIGLRSLLANCGLRGKRVSVGDIGYRIGPRLNAAGRMGKADLAVQLFFSSSTPATLEIVNHLEYLNSKRQQVEEKVYREALTMIKEKALDSRYRFLILGCEDWHRGVIGIVSSKLKDSFHRPVILFSYEQDEAYGSGRSISEFSLIRFLDECRDFFINYGGHNLAAGCVILREKIKPFKEAVNKLAGDRISAEHLRRKIYLDVRLDFERLKNSFLDYYSLLSPFGVGNSRPVFMTHGVEVVSEPRLIQNKHLKFYARQKNRTFEVLGWDRPELMSQIEKGGIIDLAYTLHFSDYLGEKKTALSLEDIRV
ncbi:MAG: single-stranded-DNA-specific exonuclease RecJ [Candidatus Aminicenantales bacterium]